MSKAYLLLVGVLSLAASARAAPIYVIETAKPRQTVRHFGASDCWSMWQIGKWDAARQKQVADWLFSLDTDKDGRPLGIGLSLWRFNLGAGSSEQGDASQIDRWTRTECLLSPDGTWNWDKQRAERNFLKLAKARGVPHFLAFCNSAPVQFTINGLATNTGRDDSMNLRDDCYDDFANFIAKAVKGIERRDGVRFDYVSPVNEPDGHWNWLGPKQEGSPAYDAQIARLARELDKALPANGVKAKILLNEASDYRCLVGTHQTDERRGYHFRHFFGKNNPETDVTSLANVLQVMAGHTYWSNTPVPFMREMRIKVREEAKKHGVKFWQTEYCIMGNDEEIGGGGGYDFTMKTALYVARLIHHDLCFADAESWSWWRAAGGDYKDGLLRVYAQNGMENGRAVDSKLLWTFGNFSRFVRPGAVRHEITVHNDDGTVRDEGWNEPYGVMSSAYRNVDGRWCVVAINYSSETRSVEFRLANEPGRARSPSAPLWRGYRTSDSEGENLKPLGIATGAVVLPPRSVTTLVEDTLPVPKHTFEVSMEKDAFLLDGNVMQIRCGEVHFPRVPRAYWRHRIQMCRAMGLNAVCAYMFWNYHEMEPGKYDFTGEKDVAEFCRIAQQEGLWVILRPGPYACAEWEFGGLPWWLMGKGSIQLRSRDPRFLEPAKAYLRRVGEELKDLQITHGGPILMVQDENEYGFYGNDGEYIRELYKTMREAGFDVPIFTCNPAYNLKNGAIPEVFKVVNFGSNPKNGFDKLREVQPKGPLMCGEYYPAWFDSWGQRHHTKPAKAMLDDIDYILSVGGSFSLYMAHGGTTFGWWNGMNSPFQSQTSSYDYDAPISEQGRVTPKFFALRDLLKKHMTPKELAELPEPPAPLPLQAFVSGAKAELVQPKNVKRHKPTRLPQSFESLGQGYGTMAYMTEIGGSGGVLHAPNLRDQAAVFADGRFLGFLDRRFPNRGVDVPAGSKTLRILVTHMSRYNFGSAMNNSEKGLLPPVKLDGKELTGWSAHGIGPDVEFMPMPESPMSAQETPCLFKRFKVTFPEQAVATSTGLPDTFLLVRGWKKGHVWVNGHPLGRFWGIGPTQTMFVPGSWLKNGVNEFVVFDFCGNVPMNGLTFTDSPVLDEMHPDCDIVTGVKRESAPFTPSATPIERGRFPDSSDAKTVMLKKRVKARKFAFVMDSDWGDKGLASIGELELLDARGESISHDLWKAVSVSSEESEKEDGMAENAIDGQISNFWHSRWGRDQQKPPHYLVFDLGQNTEVSGFRYTPRQDNRNGRVKDWRVELY